MALRAITRHAYGLKDNKRLDEYLESYNIVVEGNRSILQQIGIFSFLPLSRNKGTESSVQ